MYGYIYIYIYVCVYAHTYLQAPDVYHAAGVPGAAAALLRGSSTLSTLYPLLSSLYPLPSILYPLPSTLYALRSSLYPLPSTLWSETARVGDHPRRKDLRASESRIEMCRGRLRPGADSSLKKIRVCSGRSPNFPGCHYTCTS